MAGVRSAGGELIPNNADRSADLFASLDGFLRAQRQRLWDVFDRFDADRSGFLDAVRRCRLTSG